MASQTTIPYRKHTEEERSAFIIDFDKQYTIRESDGTLIKSSTIWDIERFWGQTFEAGQEVATRLTNAGFLLSACIPRMANYHGSSYNIGLVGLIFPLGTPNEALAFPRSKPHNNGSNLGELVYWQNWGFTKEPITVKYNLDPDSPQKFEEVAKLEQFLKQENLPFQVTPTLDEVQKIMDKCRRDLQRAENYKIERDYPNFNE